jgi:hypothetical protein
MSTQTRISRDALHEFLDGGDVLVNFTSEAIAHAESTVSLSADGTAKLVTGTAYPVSAIADAKGIARLLTSGVGRFVVASDGQSNVAEFVTQLEARNISHVVCVLEEACDADAFMDEEDSEAVAERLRQLGYI